MTSASHCDIALIGERVLPPGHPTVLAFLILCIYEGRLDHAFRRGTRRPTAEEDDRIPGSPEHVRMGLNVIGRIRKGMEIDESLRLADLSWAILDGQRDNHAKRKSGDAVRYRNRWELGQEQADRLRERVVAELRRVVT